MFNKSRTLKIPFSSRQFVVRTVSPISAVLKSSFSRSVLVSSSAADSGIRVLAIGGSFP